MASVLYLQMQPQEPDELHAKLRAWQVDPQVPADFQRIIWQRIAARQAAREDSLWPRLLGWMDRAFSRPAFATAIVLLSLTGGVVCGHAKAAGVNAHSWHDLEARYEMALNPLVREVDHLNHLQP